MSKKEGDIADLSKLSDNDIEVVVQAFGRCRGSLQDVKYLLPGYLRTRNISDATLLHIKSKFQTEVDEIIQKIKDDITIVADLGYVLVVLQDEISYAKRMMVRDSLKLSKPIKDPETGHVTDYVDASEPLVGRDTKTIIDVCKTIATILQNERKLDIQQSAVDKDSGTAGASPPLTVVPRPHGVEMPIDWDKNRKAKP